VLGQEGAISPLAWVALVLLIDVAHVHSTWFRTYFDRAQFRARAGLYVAVPLLSWALGVAIHASSAALFWTVLAYLAAFHFVRQQYGFLKLYARREPSWSEAPGLWRFKPHLDAAAVYLATLYPLLFWHAHLETRKIHWFLEGDFVSLGGLEFLLPVAQVAWGLALAGFVLTEAWLGFRNWGKLLWVAGTAFSWWLGIVGTNGDLPFTFTNVIPHGIPYFALLWASGQRAGQPPLFRWRAGWLVLVGGAIAFSFLEEAFWAGWIWRETYGIFGAFLRWLPPVQDPTLLALLVPLLALPQIVHYVLDGFIWRGGRGLQREREST
jgi:hypothetical protein